MVEPYPDGAIEMQPFAASMIGYEASLAQRFGAELRHADLKQKHRRMQESPFLFLRATCWRWAEAASELCPELMDAPAVGSVGDAHAGNFGLWRDAEARLVFGVNDYDEAAVLPYALDLVRLGASLLLSFDDAAAAEFCDPVLAAYVSGLAAPGAAVLERDNLWLRDAFAASDDEREAFWRKLDLAEPAEPPPDVKTALLAALPGVQAVRIVPRTAGAGSLGRPRYVAVGQLNGGPAAREIKGRAPSCWTPDRESDVAARLAVGRFRAPDPFLVFTPEQVLRRLAPNSRKLRFAELSLKRGRRLVRAMAIDLASIHAAEPGAAEAIGDDLNRRGADWLTSAATKVASWTRREFKAYRR
jgi:hypothetical protein